MAQRSWRKTFAELFKKEVSRDVQTHQRHLELARKCMKHAKRMTSPSVSASLQFNNGHCKILAYKLESAIQIAQKCALLHSPEVTAEAVGITKLLSRRAKEVETFIESSRKEKWIQEVVVLSNVSEHVVSSLISDLNFCILLFRNYATKAATWRELAAVEILEDLDDQNVPMKWVELLERPVPVKETVLSDQRALLSRLAAMNDHSSNSSDEKHRLVNCLSARLSQHLSGTVQLSAWEIDSSSLKRVQRLGSGSGCIVFKSTWLGVEVAEKMFYGADHPGFKNEIEILAGLVHPNIVPLLGYAMDESSCSIVMELMDGDLLFLMEERLKENRTCKYPFTMSEALDMMLQTAEGMLYLHENKIVHRDLKSPNILVKSRRDIDSDCVVTKVADFGLSKTKESSSSYSNLTSNTGTTRWMAPELIPQEEDDSCLDTKALRYPFKVDVYGFGMVCFEILTGRVPFSTISSFKEIKKMVLNGTRPELPDYCLHDVKILIHSCWEPQPNNRPSFVEICKELRFVKYSLLRGSGMPYAAYRREFEAYADQLAREPYARQKESKATALRLATTAVRALTYNFSEMEPIQGSRSMFRATMGGLVVAVLQLWKLNHANVLPTIGCRLEEKFKMVVFEYASLGSLHNVLHGKVGVVRDPNAPVLTWMQRVKIAVGVARGLKYLHGDSPPIICGSTKSWNILMFDDDVAKIGDFALLQRCSPLLHEFDTRWVDILPAPAPELINTGETYSQESDIWDFGVLLLELLTGNRPPSAQKLKFLRTMLTEDNFHRIVDPRLSSNYPSKAVAKMAAVAALCVQDEPDYRPHAPILVKALQPLLVVQGRRGLIQIRK